jgi:tetratricopeptide (TPR) repeat protein
MRPAFPLTLLFLWPAAGLAADQKIPAPAKDSYGAVENLASELKRSPSSQESKLLLPLLRDIKTADQARERLPRLNAAARGLFSAFTREKPPAPLAKAVQNAVAYLNNQADRWEDGREFSDKVLSFDPDDRAALINRSNANYGLKDFNSAFIDADKAAKLDPQDPAAYTARALASYGMKNYLQTLEDARRSLAIDPGDKTASSLLNLAEGRKPSSTAKNENIRVEAVLQREYQGMVQQLNQAEEKRKDLPSELASPAVNRLIRGAASKLSLRDYPGALKEADRAIEAAPNNATAFYYKATAYNLLGRYEEAVASASQALALNPNDVASRDARAWAQNHLDQFHNAIADSDQSLELDPADPYAYANRGFAHEKLGDIDAMVSDLKRAADLSPQFEPVYRDAMAMHNLSTLPAKTREFREPGTPAAVAQGSRGQLLIALAGSLAAGLLVAFGLLHVVDAHKSKPASKPGQPQDASASRTPSGIDSSYDMGPAIGRGGMGLVFEAVDRALRRKVAVKILRDEFKLDAKAKERFLEEARTVAALHHPCIVDIHSIVEDEAGLYMVFEYIEGKTVDELLVEKKRFGLDEAKNVMRHVCQALEFAHRHNVVHRDLKPSNIMITDDGQVKVMDFGISRHAKDVVSAQAGERKYSVTNSIVGTPYYMSPEQEYGIVRPESDIFSLGACLYEMLSGQRPYPPPATTQLKLARDYAKLSSIATGLSPRLDAFMDDALDPDPDKRIASAARFWALLEKIT